ncbi:MAG: 4-alpha-glucanotransferase, partial [Nitrospinaceae bacterium]|nr:4-alpha-glucanotransferase [Nitrospinaceae bacterium]
YTGTHDCNTVRGWYDDELTEETKTELESVLDKKVCSNTVSEAMVILAMSSIADTVILPMQDVLGLGANARMNRPGQVENNWEWRLLPDQWTNESIDQVAETTHKYGRC